MKVVVCGSSKFRKEKVKLVTELNNLGHNGVIDPWTVEVSAGQDEELLKMVEKEPAEAKKKHDFIRWYFEAIKDSDSILIYNPKNKGIENYIGANSFLEIGYAHVLNKKIFLYFEMPNQDYLRDELEAIEPISLFGNISNIKD